VKTDREVVLEAAQIIRDNGFGKRNYYNDETNCYCVIGAIRQAVFGFVNRPLRIPGLESDEYRQMNRIEKCINRLLIAQGKYPNIISWNDEAETTREDVLALLEQAAEAS
jgi:hypothetical protein